MTTCRVPNACCVSWGGGRGPEGEGGGEEIDTAGRRCRAREGRKNCKHFRGTPGRNFLSDGGGLQQLFSKSYCKNSSLKTQPETMC